MIVLHHCHETRSMRVLWLLHELEVEFQVRVRPFDRSLRDPEYLSLSPAGRVPALEIDGETLWESGAIMEVLCERFAERGLGRPPGDIDRPDWLVWLHFAETVSQHSAALTQQHIALREDAMRSPVIMRLEAARLRKCYAAIEARLSTPVENREHLLTSGFSAADIAVGQAVYMARHFAALDDFPETARWYAQITQRPAFLASLPPEGAERLFARDFYPAWDR
ncbi:D-fructose-6-phosphate amidotransferase [Oceaniovalibus guishaninsula JLT2003]|uniref:D-fructose-6-phosphate amidotransferase n=1 Tax=Oceaniovalibus guishaninsula JLT2003 TaxID=1231392 RepID=K2HQZ3_9RHOB|nr:glutathione S-transferase family protein [Oceaniovalibus guishaninsula]EKE45144.1 D-fructose-6-phosphate amidotransferase [Oceaniovalibus guishaninsula JLT2003]